MSHPTRLWKPRLRACRSGLTGTRIARLLGVARETVARWRFAFADRGVEDLRRRRSGRPRGSGRAPTDSRGNAHPASAAHRSARETGRCRCPWTGRVVVASIRRQYDLVLAERTIGRDQARRGSTTERPRRHSHGQDPDEATRRLESTRPTLKDRAERERATIYRGDEAGVAADQAPATGYAPQGEPASLDAPAESRWSATPAKCV